MDAARERRGREGPARDEPAPDAGPTATAEPPAGNAATHVCTEGVGAAEHEARGRKGRGREAAQEPPTAEPSE